MFIHQLFTGSKVVWKGKRGAGSVHMVGNRFNFSLAIRRNWNDQFCKGRGSTDIFSLVVVRWSFKFTDKKDVSL